jgi:hypothetical protein
MSNTDGSSDLSAEVARLAYERFVARGLEHGHDLDDWFAAEEELRRRNTGTSEAVSTTGRSSTPKTRVRRRVKSPVGEGAQRSQTDQLSRRIEQLDKRP